MAGAGCHSVAWTIIDLRVLCYCTVAGALSSCDRCKAICCVMLGVHAEATCLPSYAFASRNGQLGKTICMSGMDCPSHFPRAGLQPLALPSHDVADRGGYSVRDWLQEVMFQEDTGFFGLSLLTNPYKAVTTQQAMTPLQCHADRDGCPGRGWLQRSHPAGAEH